MNTDPDDWSELCIALGGSSDSWTGAFLHLVAKSDPSHRGALRAAAPGHVAAWEAWMQHADGKGAGVAAARAAYRLGRTYPEAAWLVPEETRCWTHQIAKDKA